MSLSSVFVGIYHACTTCDLLSHHCDICHLSVAHVINNVRNIINVTTSAALALPLLPPLPLARYGL